MKRAHLLIPPLLLLAACATPGRHSGELSSYQGLKAKEGTLRTSVVRRADQERLAKVARVAVRPARVADNDQTRWLTDKERELIVRELDAQLCFELSKRYEFAAPETADAEVRAVVTRVAATGRAGSVVSAASNVFIPGPIGLRVPGTAGGLGAEAEMVARDGGQLAALVWNRNATPIGTDDPSLSRIGDALQFAEPFGDTVGQVMTAKGPDGKRPKARKIDDPDPCAEFGPRFRPEGFLASFATGLYIPEAAGAKKAKDPAKDD